MIRLARLYVRIVEQHGPRIAITDQRIVSVPERNIAQPYYFPALTHRQIHDQELFNQRNMTLTDIHALVIHIKNL